MEIIDRKVLSISMKRLVLLLAGMLLMALSACGKSDPVNVPEDIIPVETADPTVTPDTGRKLANPNVKIPVLMYHHFDETYTDSVTVHPETFREQLLRLKEEGFTTISTTELLQFYNGEADLPEKPILITMDDGYMSNYELAFPILKELEMKATIFVIVDRINYSDHHYIPWLVPKLTWEEAREMVASGLVEIHSHTFDMHQKKLNSRGMEVPVILEPIRTGEDLRTLETEEAYRKRVLEDLMLAKQTIEKETGQEAFAFCYPYGSYNETSEELVKLAGYKMSFTIQPGVNTLKSGPFLLKRINVHGDFSADDMMKEIYKYLK